MNITKITYKMVAFCYTVWSVVVFSACADDAYNEENTVPGQATLTLKTQTLRAGSSDDETISSEEAMHSLRIVILSKSKNGYWTVEHNDFDDFDGPGIRVSDERKFNVEGELTKRIYLIANEGQVKDLEGNKIDLTAGDMYIPNHRTGIALIDSVSFFPRQEDDLSQTGLPMTAMYEFEMGKTSEEKTCYVVRAVSKITFSYTNSTTQIPENPGPGDVISSKKRKIKLLGWTLENIADQSYLMPCVNTNAEGKYHVVNTERNELVPLDGNWIDWMKKETEKNTDTDIESYQWLTDYEVPERATHSVYTHWYSKETNAPDAPVIEPKADGIDERKHTYADAPIIYLPESRNPEWAAKDEQETDANPATDELKLQQYRLTVITNELDLDEKEVLDESDPKKWKAASYTAILPHLCSLFRNTHVKVNITFKGAGQFAIYAEIEPWGNAGEYQGELVPETNPPTGN